MGTHNKSKIFTDFEYDILDDRFNGKKAPNSVFGDRIRPKLIEFLDVWTPKIDKIKRMIDNSSTSGYSHEQLLDKFNKKKEELGGRTPTNKELGISQSVFKRYGGYRSFLKQIGSKPNRNTYTKEELEKIIRYKKRELGRVPTLKELGLYTYHFKPYESYNKFLKDIGEIPHLKKYNKKQLITIMLTKKRQLGRRPTRKELGIDSSQFKPYGGYNTFYSMYKNGEILDVLNISRNNVKKKYDIDTPD